MLQTLDIINHTMTKGFWWIRYRNHETFLKKGLAKACDVDLGKCYCNSGCLIVYLYKNLCLGSQNL
jgi:hypothetical protein